MRYKFMWPALDSCNSHTKILCINLSFYGMYKAHMHAPWNEVHGHLVGMGIRLEQYGKNATLVTSSASPTASRTRAKTSTT